MKLFLDTYGVRGSGFYKGKSVVFKEGKTRIQPSLWNKSGYQDKGGLAFESDFFAILLDEKIRQKLGALGVGILACDPSTKIKENEVVIICGHPVIEGKSLFHKIFPGERKKKARTHLSTLTMTHMVETQDHLSLI